MSVSKMRKQYEEAVDMVVEGVMSIADGECLAQPYIEYKNAHTVRKDGRTSKQSFIDVINSIAA